MIRSKVSALAFICCAPCLLSCRAEAGIAWAWAQSETGTFTADANFSFNDAGGAVTISHLGTGMYRVTFAGQDLSFGNVQAMAYGSTDRMCTIVTWGGNDVQLKCWAPNGTLMNSRFVVSFINYQDESGGPSTGFYLWNNLSTTSGTPSLSYQWSSQPITNGSQSSSRTDVGVYEIFHDWTGGSTVPIVTAYSSAEARYCTALPVSFGQSVLSFGTLVTCFNASGVPADSRFSLSVSNKSHFGFQASGMVGQGRAAMTIPSNPNPGTPTVTFEGSGIFRARFPSLIPANKSMALASSGVFRSATSRVVISGWGGFGGGAGTDVVVRCFRASDSALVGNCVPFFAYGTTQP